MKSFVHALYLVFICLAIISCEKSPSAICCFAEDNDGKPETLKVLFIGNSFTSWHNMTNTVGQMASAMDDSLHFFLATGGGYSFKDHYHSKNTRSGINSEQWDYAVLQESGWTSALPESMLDTITYTYADSVVNLIKKNNTNTKILLYLPHAYQDGADWCDWDTSLCNYEGMQLKMRSTYLNLSNQLTASVAPAGMAWYRFKESYPDINLHDRDRDHSNPTGAYLTACTLYSSLFNKKPYNTYCPDDISEEIARNMHDIVSKMLFDCIPEWQNYQ